MRPVVLFAFLSTVFLGYAMGQTAIDVPRDEKDKAKREVEKQQEKKAQRTAAIEFQGQNAFNEKDLRSALKEQIATIEQFGLTAARADDVAFFLELFYRKHGYAKISVRYKIEPGDRLRLEVNEGPLIILGKINFTGNAQQPSETLFEYAVGPTRERYSRLQKLPYVESDIEEGARLVQRFYVAEGFLRAEVDPPMPTYSEDSKHVNVMMFIHEGPRYFFGNVSFSGQTIYGAEALRGQILDLIEQPYTEARVNDIPRRLEAYFKARGYFNAKVAATADPAAAANGKVPVQVAIAPGPLYHFGEAEVNGLQRLNPTFVTKRFRDLNGQTYSPDVLDQKFRTLMRTGLFNVLRIKPVPVEGNLLRLEIAAEEAKSKQFGLSVGYGTYDGPIGGVQFREHNLFGTGRSITFSIEASFRSYKGEILYEDPFFLDTEFVFKNRLAALTYDFEGYSKFEIGDRIELTRKITKNYEVGAVFSVRRVEVTSADIRDHFLGDTSYLINSLGFFQTLDLRESPLVSPRGLLAGSTLDVATSAFGGEIELVRATFRLGYYLPFGPKVLTPGIAEDKPGTALQRWWQQSSLAFGARLGVVHSLTKTGGGATTEIPIDERFFSGGANTVRSFVERDLGPHDKRGHPIGGEFFTVFNVEYGFPIYGELQGALFADAGNLLPTSEDPGINDMRYGLGVGLRYKLPIGPIRLDYGINPDRRRDEDFGAFHFSFGFAF